jgi:hypothetical protein
VPKRHASNNFDNWEGSLTVNDVEAQERDSRSHVEAILPSAPSGIAHRFSMRTTAILLCVWILALLYMGFYLKRSWVPHDEGTFAQSAERVLKGELPHRDFVDNYTGGLTFLNAVGFRIFGVNLASLRIVLFILFALWVPCVFYVAFRFVPAVAAGAITLLAVAWSVPNYPACVPSWYNLFFAVFGISALLRYMEVGSRRWLFMAGLCGGFSIVVKITGLYFVFAVILFLIFRDQNLSCAVDNKSSGGSLFFRTFVTTGLVLFLLALTRLVNRIQGVAGIIYFAIPSAFLVILLLYREFAESRGRDKDRFAKMYSMFAPFGAGVAIPVLVFLVPFVLSNSTGALLHDLFDGSEKQLLFAATSAPRPSLMLATFPVALLVAIILVSHRQGRSVYTAFLSIYLGAILIFSPNNHLVYAQGWCSLVFAIPAITLGGVITLGNPHVARRLDEFRQQQIFLLLAAMALISVVQFPFSIPVYFCYVSPFVILAATALYASVEWPPRFAFGSLIVFYLTFAVFLVTPGFNLGSISHATRVETARLTLARAGSLRVDPVEAQVYEAVIPAIRSRAAGGFIYAAPDCPEVYFLAGLQNPTRTIFDFRDDPVGRKERILSALKSHGVNVVAINSEPQFSKPLEPELVEALEQLYPNSEEIGKFELRWKTDMPHGN